ncbi:hypothetical protein GW17_00010679 [Ensete ventricosum]|nr:hypothetical protein GW17_00010679 [Ensete ventricosum]RZS02063.1 hypothetical protein BHM03_00032032 [Ensete ventricosum]
MSSASSHSESRSVKISAHRSRVLSHPSGDSVSVAIVPSSSALGDSGIADALAMMRSFFNVDSIMTTRRLVEVRKNYFIPLEHELHVPLPGERPYDAFPCGLSLSTDAVEAGLRFSLHPVIEACLEQWRISPSQMAPNSWQYLLPDRVDLSDSEQLCTDVVNLQDRTGRDPPGDPFHFKGCEGHE